MKYLYALQAQLVPFMLLYIQIVFQRQLTGGDSNYSWEGYTCALLHAPLLISSNSGRYGRTLFEFWMQEGRARSSVPTSDGI